MIQYNYNVLSVIYINCDYKVKFKLNFNNLIFSASVRVRYIGENGTSVVSLPVSVSCGTAPLECHIRGTFTEVTPASQFVPQIVPILECLAPMANNNFLGFFGYNNLDSAFYSVPVGPLNTFSGNSDRAQPTTFISGRTGFFPKVGFTTVLTPGFHSWRLTNYNVSIDTSDTSRYCPQKFLVGVQLTNSTEISRVELDLIEANIEKQFYLNNNQVAINGINVARAKKREDSTDVSELEVEISTASGTSEPDADPQEIIQDFVDTVANATAAQEVFNPLNDTNREVLAVKTQPTGLEQEGQVIPQAPVAAPKTSSGVRLRGENSSFSTVMVLLVSLVTLITFTSRPMVNTE